MSGYKDRQDAEWGVGPLEKTDRADGQVAGRMDESVERWLDERMDEKATHDKH